jgi:hypothetical protein
MNPDAIPVWTLFVAAVVIVMLSIEVGYRSGRGVHRRSDEEKESPVSAIAGSVLGLVAFMLAFTFSIVTDRHSVRKSLVREEANAIRTTWQRTDFLPEPDRAEAVKLLREYVDTRLDAIHRIRSGEKNIGHMDTTRTGAERIQRRLWEMAVANARKDMNSDVAALYVQSLNKMNELHATRVVVGLQQRIPGPIWIVLSCLTICGMAAMGYQTGISGSKQSAARTILAVSFSLVIALIASLDRPGGGVLKVSQQPLIDLGEAMD